ncbi:aldo/keto reductase [Companilactobacillus halodurans]|uniref:Aldo/keto reductase n=1 Tax=Companilactobacillus halodurans TaxID=2584183 RepID=A0A5P0ZKX0_9LACO|nr:aldo/keto reductase [Companilactobacillus halodurans]MQS74858.1 aldo/keto reductase [Companilactobacillus halodurans]MQS97253.1 aldo/keto reductase [Companilactobacillus halodurans]
MKSITFNQQKTSAIGIGTWHIGEGDANKTESEIKALQYGLDNGINLIDTAEMYGEGLSETLIGNAIKDYDRSKFQLISKFYPYHATEKLIEKSLKASLKRLQTDYLDLYLLHWRGQTPLAETVNGLEKMVKAGLIKNWGVSNFDLNDLKELDSISHGSNCRINEDLYNISSRSIEYSILPWQKEHQMSFVGYSPFGSDGGQYLKIKPVIKEMAQQKHITVHQLLLAWVLRNHDVLSIPKTSSVEHMKSNLFAVDVEFSQSELDLLDESYPKPNENSQLEII